MKYSIMKQCREIGNVQVKNFNSSDAMHKFLNKQHDNKWQTSIYTFPKSGVYFSQYTVREGGRSLDYINVKELIC